MMPVRKPTTSAPVPRAACWTRRRVASAAASSGTASSSSARPAGVRDRAAVALEQLRAELLLERLDLPAERGLGDVQGFGRPAEVQLLRDGDEPADLDEIEVCDAATVSPATRSVLDFAAFRGHREGHERVITGGTGYIGTAAIAASTRQATASRRSCAATAPRGRDDRPRRARGPRRPARGGGPRRRGHPRRRRRRRDRPRRGPDHGRGGGYLRPHRRRLGLRRHRGVADEDAPQNPPAIVAWREDNERAVLAPGGRLIVPGLVYGEDAGLIQRSSATAA